MVEAVVEKYSIVTGIQKAVKNTAIQSVAGFVAIFLGFLVTNPGIIATILGNVSGMTVLEVTLALINFAINWLKNRNLGNAQVFRG